jgi:hypothetical protein
MKNESENEKYPELNKSDKENIFKFDYLPKKIKISLERSNLFIFCDYSEHQSEHQEMLIYEAMKSLLNKEKELRDGCSTKESP